MRRLVLFDIDGTLVRGGPAKEAFELALERVFGTAGRVEGHDFSGKTDPQIARELLQGAGFHDREIDEKLPALWREYLAELERRLPEQPMVVLPGVRSLLETLAASGASVGLGLLTGNILGGARLKLSAAGLLHFFAVGGFGSDHEVREELTAVAVRRAEAWWETRFPPHSVVVVGDTPRDVACGRAEGARTVAVATGKFDERALEEAGADHVLPDLSDLDSSLEAIGAA